jgi:hypothetical protein
MTEKQNEKQMLHRLHRLYQANWNQFARDELKVKLDSDQQRILQAIQTSKRVSVRSGNARGKDFVAAVASICFLMLNNPAKVINTAPTGRQAVSIMMSEIARIYQIAKGSFFLHGEVLSSQIKFLRPDKFLLAFKAKDKATEAWTGFHSQNLMVVITEASGIETETFNAVESILTGHSKLLIVFNPNQPSGEAWKSVKDKRYARFKLNCLNAPNVIEKKIIIPGQVDYEWVVDKVEKWCSLIDRSIANEDDGDFEFEQKWYRPNDLFMVKVQGEFPREGDDKLIPYGWIELAHERWEEMMAKTGAQYSDPMRLDFDNVDFYHKLNITDPLKLGVDVAGMGRDMTVFCYRYDRFVLGFKQFAKSDHMETAGKIKNELDKENRTLAYIDTIGEGAGVYSRLIEQKAKAISVKFSASAKGNYDMSLQRKFANMRAYCWWAIRDALDPKFDTKLALPPIDELTQDLNEPLWKVRSDGSIIIEEKDEIKKRLGRSPDFGDSLAVTYYPAHQAMEIYFRAGKAR